MVGRGRVPDEDNAEKEQYAKGWECLRNCDGILVPGGFGARAVEGKILAAKYARENKKPYLGMCLGFQVAVIEFARHVLGHTTANSTEFEQGDAAPGRHLHARGLEDAHGRHDAPRRAHHGDAAHRLQGVQALRRRERVRRAAPPQVRGQHRSTCPRWRRKGLEFVGRDTSRASAWSARILEVKNHPFFLAAQYHPEFKSRPLKPSPLFYGLICAASGVKPENTPPPATSTAA